MNIISNPTITALAGTIVGGTFSYLAGTRQNALQFKLDRHRRRNELLERKFDVYNKVMKADGGFKVIRFDLGRKYVDILDVPVYKTQIRPILFEGLHVIDGDVREKLRELDQAISGIDFLSEIGEWPDKEEHEASSLYIDLIKLIEKHYDDHNLAS